MAKKKEKLGKEAGAYGFVGVVVTAIDFGVLNLCTLVFGFPIIVANILSTTSSSIVSFLLNKNLTFDGRRHGRFRTIARYVVIVAIGIYVIQNSVIYLVQHHFSLPFDVVRTVLDHIGLAKVPDTVIDNNVAKIIGAWASGIWHFFMLRRFVFVPDVEKTEDDSKGKSERNV